MQFSIATLAVLATAVMAESTKYITEEVTITSCAPTVTDCPARSTVVSKTTYPVIVTSAPATYTRYTTIVNTITSCAPTVTNCPYGSLTSTVIPITSTAVQYSNCTTSTGAGPKPTSSAAPVPVVPVVPVVPAGPATVTVTVNYCPAPSSTLVPVVPVQPTTPVAPVVPATSAAVVPAPSGAPVKPANGTAVTTSTPPKFTGAAATMSGSLGAVALAGVIAVFFA